MTWASVGIAAAIVAAVLPVSALLAWLGVAVLGAFCYSVALVAAVAAWTTP